MTPKKLESLLVKLRPHATLLPAPRPRDDASASIMAEFEATSRRLEDALEGLAEPRIRIGEDGQVFKEVGRLRFVGSDALTVLEDTLNELASDPDLGLSSRAVLLAVVARLLLEGLQDPQNTPLLECARRAIENLTARPLHEWRVLRSIHGVVVEPTTPIDASSSPARSRVELGPFPVSTWEDYERTVWTGHPMVARLGEHIRPWSQVPRQVVEVRVRARDGARAREIADSRYTTFDNALRYMIADQSGRFGVGVLDPRHHSFRTYVALSETGGLAQGATSHGPSDEVRLNDPYFVDANNGNRRVWELLGREQPSAWERKLLAAIDWIGKAVHDPNPDDAFVQYVFALEALLLFHEKNVHVGPSIVHAISESSAFVLGDTLEGRIAVESDVKRLYGVRSAVAHGRAAAVSPRDLRLALRVSKGLVMAFLVRPEFASLASPEQFLSWVQKQRYDKPSGGA